MINQNATGLEEAICWFDVTEQPYGYKLTIVHHNGCRITRQFTHPTDRQAAIDIAEACMGLAPNTLVTSFLSGIDGTILERRNK